MTDGLMFPKPGKQKKRKKHKKTILHGRDGTCYLCMRLNGDYSEKRILHKHHVYEGKPGRQISEREGFTVYLCLKHHLEGPEAVHNNKENRRLIQRDCQREYEKTHTRQQFMDLLRRNYLDDEET